MPQPSYIHMTFPTNGSIVQLGGKHWRIKEVEMEGNGAHVKADGVSIPGSTIEFDVEVKLTITDINLG